MLLLLPERFDKLWLGGANIWYDSTVINGAKNQGIGINPHI